MRQTARQYTATLGTHGHEHKPHNKTACTGGCIVNHKYKHLKGEERLVAAIEENVLVQINNLSTHPGIAMLLATGELKVFGWYFDIATGHVHHYNPISGQFEELTHDDQGVSAIPLRHI